MLAVNTYLRKFGDKISYMPTTNLKNIAIKKLEDKNLKSYYLIVNNENLDEAYFCFEGTVKDGWDSLRKHYCLVNIFLAILRGLKLPVKLLAGLLAKRRKKRSELEENWQRSVGRDKKKRKRKRKVAKKLNHSKV
ncbi:4815_t:CDS:2 [Funneliformis geosporum]|nr:4815_t:CDS:2 [Funneliformis geosporum]